MKVRYDMFAEQLVFEDGSRFHFADVPEKVFVLERAIQAVKDAKPSEMGKAWVEDDKG